MTEDEANTTLDDIAAAWDAAEQETSDADQFTGESEESEAPQQLETSDASEPEERTEQQGEDGAPSGVETSSPESQISDKGPEGSEQAEVLQKPAEQDVVCPVSLPAAAREEWKNTPKAMKDAIAKRERDYAVGIQKHAEGAKRAAQMDQVLSPYRQYFAINGNNPAKTVSELLQTAASLHSGAPLQKAQQVVNLIHQFGVDVQAVDKLLVGETPDQPAPAQDHAIQQAVQQAVAPYQQHMQQIQQAQAQQTQKAQGAAMDELQRFSQDPKNEFFRDVRMDMADILDFAAKRGMDMSLEDAYHRACQLHPEVSKVIGSRVQQQTVQRKRRASSSVAGSPGGPGGAQAPVDMRGAIEQAWDNAGRM